MDRDARHFLSEKEVRDWCQISRQRWPTWKARGWTPRLIMLPGRGRPVCPVEELQRWLSERERHRKMLGKPFLRRPLSESELRAELAKQAARDVLKGMPK